MCLGLPGQIVEIIDAENKIGKVDVAGVKRTVHLGLLKSEEAQIGTWVIINAGMAISAIDEQEASDALRFVQELDQQFGEEAK